MPDPAPPHDRSAPGRPRRSGARLGSPASILTLAFVLTLVGGCTSEPETTQMNAAGSTRSESGAPDASSPDAGTTPAEASATSREPRADRGGATLVAHRGASAYAPEHTLAAYRLAIEQGADFIEPDLQVTRDGVLVCLHDLTLERTTDVEEVFPDRYREEVENGETVRRWYVSDFTLTEIRRLDAGLWFGPRFQGARVPTLAEAIELARARAGIYPETKAPEVYGALGFSMERLLIDVLEEHALLAPGADPRTPVVIQSFSDESLRVLGGELSVRLPLVFLISSGEPVAEDEMGAPETWLSPEGLDRVAEFASGIGPAKGILLERPRIVEWAHAEGLEVVPWTFRSDNPGGFADVEAEMRHFLFELGVDGLFTNNPDLFPREAP